MFREVLRSTWRLQPGTIRRQPAGPSKPSQLKRLLMQDAHRLNLLCFSLLVTCSLKLLCWLMDIAQMCPCFLNCCANRHKVWQCFQILHAMGGWPMHEPRAT